MGLLYKKIFPDSEGGSNRLPFFIVLTLFVSVTNSCNLKPSATSENIAYLHSELKEQIEPQRFHYEGDSLIAFDFINPTYLGNKHRNYYGDKAPNNLNLAWKKYLGKGITMVGSEEKIWYGAGWTGQPLLVSENDKKYIIQGAYDHHLRKIDWSTGKEVWKYKYDDVIKGTGSLYYNRYAKKLEDKIIILQGSRKGVTNNLLAKNIYSYRGISYMTGKEKWRLNSPKTRSYSRDVDGSALILGDTAYLGFENGFFQKFSPLATKSSLSINSPTIFSKHLTFDKKDILKHGGNLVTESSPSILGDTIYFTSGAGHIWGYNVKKDTLDWEFFTGSDIDGSVIITDSNTLITTIEKQYISGQGGVIHIDPRKDSVLWYYPTKNKTLASWEGGIIGSACTNEKTKDSHTPHLTATNSIDGTLYVLETHSIDTSHLALSFDNKTKYPTPKVIFKYKVGPSISTPIFVGDKLIAAGYHGIYLFQYKNNTFELLDKRPGLFESTPVVHDDHILIASKGDGYLYKLGGK